MSTHFHPLKVKEIVAETPECVSVAFEVPADLQENFKFKAGQYLTFKTTLNNEEVRRSYSICTAPHENELRVAIKQVQDGKFSTFANQTLKVGDTLDTMVPTGTFCINKENGITHKSYLGFVAGSGITPLFGIIKDVLANDPTSTFTLVYGNKNRGNIIFKEGIEALKNKFMERLVVHHLFTRETADAPLFNGRINGEKAKALAQIIDYSKIDEIFICGPEDMIHSLRDYFMQEVKFDAKHLHFELFASPDQPRVASKEWLEKMKHVDTTKVSKVTIKLDGTSFQFDLPYDGETILDAALKQGADLPFACKGGVCCTCRAKVTAGDVDMEVNYALEPDELENNFVLTCQAHPRSEEVIVDFDIK